MKKKVIIFLVAILSISMVALTTTACKGRKKHSHVFDKQVVNANYLQNQATCESKATYFYSCSCGEKGTQAFEYGEALGHNFVNYVSNNDATYNANGTKTASCERGCGKTNTIEDIGTQLKYTLTIVFGNGEDNLVITQNYNSDIDVSAIVEPTKVGYKFVGWDKEIPSKMPAQNTTITAQWEIKQYSLTFVLDNEEEDVVITQNYNGDIDASAIVEPTKVGYKFVGWDKEIPSKMPAQNTTITAQWDIEQYSLTFVLDNGEDNLVITQNYNSDIDVSAIVEPTKVGYKFVGWDKEIPSKMPAQNTTITAQWEIKQYSLTFVLDNEEEDFVITQNYNGDIDASAIVEPTKVGYKFVGWDKEIPSKMPAQNTTITAQWEIKQYSLTFVLDNGEDNLVITQNYNSDIDVNAIVAPTKVGYKFVGWDKEIPSKMPAQNTTITAQWDIEQYTLTIKLNNGQKDIVLTQDYGSDIEAIADPVKEGYKFSGWDSQIPSKMPAGNRTVNATWSIQQYTLTIVYGNGQENLVITQNYDTDILATIVTPTREHATFLGWDKEIPSKMPGQDLTITAQWDVEQYTLTIKLNNGQEDIVLTQDYGSDIEAIADPVKEGYKFSGWDSQIPSKMPAGNRTVNATWSIKQYTLTIVYGNGQENLVITQDYDSYILTTIGTPTKEHATFRGWDKEIPSKMPAQDLTITALWEINQYSLIFVLDNGEEDVVITQDYDTDILANIVTPTREHATFLGWDKEIPSKMPGQNLTITALWEIKQYSLTFVLDNGEEDVVITQEYGSDIGAIANPEKVGYKFVGWDKEIPSKMPGQNLTITALWEINQYTLTFVLNNGEDNLVITQNYNSDIDASAIVAPTKVGYIFKGWDKEIPTKMPAENLIITAQWEMNNAYYKVETYLQNIDNDEYTLDKSNSYTAYGLVDTMVEVKPLKMEHFTFNEEMSSLSGKVDADGKLVLVGYYTRQYYSLSNENSTIGTITNEGSYKYGSELTSSVSKDMLLGYEFIGWYAGKTLLSTESTYTFTISQDVTAKFDMLKEMTNYSFDSTFTSCVLNSVKDTSITSAIVPDCVTEVSGNLFNGCTNLKTLIIGNGVSQLPGGLLKGCSNLQSLTIPFVGASKNSTTASPSTLFGYIFGTSSFDGAEIAKQEYKYNFYEEYYVPTSLKTVVVTGGKVLHGAFQGCKNIENITIPNDLTTIEDYVFKSCTNLTNVIIPENVTSIGSNAFYECKYLYNIDIPENVTFIGYGAFYQCTRLQTIVIPDKVTKIDGFAFYGCDSLVKVTVGKSVTEIGTSAFMFSNKIIEIYNKSNLVFEKGEYSYGAIASSVKNIYTPTSGTAKLSKDANGYLIYTDGEDKILVAYQGNSTILEIPSDITKIHNYAFKYGKEDFTIVKLPLGLKEIGIEAFLGCENLTYISVPDSVTKIDSRAFADCSGLETLIIGNGVKYLSLGLLEGCSNLKNLTIPFVGYEKNVENKDTVLFGYIFGNEEFANTKAVEQYWAEDSFVTFYIPTSLTTVTVTGGKIFYGAFYGCDMLTKITLQNVTSIGEQAFVGCSGLTSIVIPDSVESIGAKAFFYSKTLTNVTIGTGLKSVGEHAFDGCDNIVKVKYTGDINGWAQINFADWANPLSNTIAGLYIDDKLVTSATINSNSIGTNVFYNYKKLESVTIGSSVANIGIAAFACTNITSVVFEENSTCSMIADYAFWGCESLESIDLPSSLKTIGKNAFEWCTNLTSVDFGENSTCSLIDDCAFKDCVNLESIVLPSSLTFIGKNAFENCTALTSVTGTQNWYLVQYINDTVSKINFSNLAPEVFAQYLTGEYKDYYWKC